MEAHRVCLELNSISKHFGGIAALESVDFQLRTGEVAALVGDNGAGKSTLVKVVSGAHQPDSGRIVLDDEEQVFSTPMAAREAGIETVYQNLAMVDYLDVVTNLFLGREKKRFRAGLLSILDLRGMVEQAHELLARTGVSIPDLKVPLLNLSGGQRQGVAISRAAGWGSKIILMDEPTAALGVRETARVEEIIAGLRGKGIAVLIVSHNLRQVFDLADHIWVMRRGEMVGHMGSRECSPEDVVRLITGADQVVTG